MSGVLPEFVDFAHTLADEAGKVISPLFRKTITIDYKEDESPVTIADREAERVMADMIKSRYPDHGIWGEEFGRHKPDAKYCWVLDPIDGTKSFIMGFPTFGTLISLVRLGVPVLGLIDQPINKERWIGGASLVARFNGKAIKIRPCKDLAAAILSTTSPRLFDDADKVKFERVQQKVHHVKYGYDCYAYAQLANGFIDIVIESGLKPHDFCALRPIIESAGGAITDWQGNPLTLASDGRILAAGDKILHTEIISILNS